MVAAVTGYDPELPVLCLPGSALAQLAVGAGLRWSPRPSPTAATCPTARWCRAARPARWSPTRSRWPPGRCGWPPSGRVVAVDGTVIPCPVESICVHGDTPGAVSAAELVRAALIDADVPLAPFA